MQRWYETKKGQRHIIHWSENFAIKNEEIDKDHKILFKIANDAFLMSQEGADKTKLKEVITKLLDYFKSHFEHEENFMKEINYPRIEHHQKLHHSIIELTNRLLKGIPSMDTKTFELELALFVEKHLVTHIEYDDMKIKHFLNGDDEMSIVLDDM
ncbi:MAG: hemerythrin family protein [Campylobacterota bacterium]|nr:hemerythrin family protein [Campylobacterota bacterium]